MSPEDRIRLLHMIEAAEQAMLFTTGMTKPELENDLKTLFAVIRCIEIIGEAAARMSDGARLASPDVPWTAMIGMRNRLVHAYFDVDTEVVWRTLTDELPDLSQLLRRLV
jgi:uncharacterized protein with HEPN domain